MDVVSVLLLYSTGLWGLPLAIPALLALGLCRATKLFCARNMA